MSAQADILRAGAGARACAARWRPATACSCACIRSRGRLTADQARLIAQAAREYGNGHLDITARGNLQIRGVRAETYPGLLARLDREGLVEPEGDGPNRLTVLSPLAGLDPLERCDALALAQAIENAAGAIEGLPAKFFVAVDGGGAMPLDAIGADLHLLATGEDVIAFGDLFARRPALDRRDVPLAARRMPFTRSCQASRTLRRMGRTEARRLRDLRARSCAGACGTRSSRAGDATAPATGAPRAGILSLEQRTMRVLLALPFGRCNAEQLVQAAAWSERFGSGELRLSFTRGLLLPGIADEHVPALARRRPAAPASSPMPPIRASSLFACPGRPACGSASHRRSRRCAADRRSPAGPSSARRDPSRLGLPERLRPSGHGRPHARRPRAMAAMASCPAARPAMLPPFISPSTRSCSLIAFDRPGRPAPCVPGERRVSGARDYIREGAEIYRRSFAIIRAEADLVALFRHGRARRRAHDPCLRHDRPAARRRAFARFRRSGAKRALQRGAPILCDAKMVANGVTRARLPADNEVICTLDDPRVPALAARARHHPLGRRHGVVARAPGRRARGRSAMRRPRSFACSKCSMRARRSPPP